LSVVTGAKAKPVKTPPASNFAVEANADIFPSLSDCGLYLRNSFSVDIERPSVLHG
jgi:hypothetical protein